MVDKLRIDYEPALSADRTHLQRHGLGFTLKVPPCTTWRTAVHLAIIISSGCLCLAGAFWPAGTTQFAGATVEHPGGLVGRLVLLAVAGLLFLAAATTVARSRGWSIVELDGRTLRCTVPSIRRPATRTFDIRDCRDAVLVNDEGSPRVRLVREDGGEDDVLLEDHNGSTYRRADLEAVVAHVRAAIARARVQKPVRPA